MTPSLDPLGALLRTVIDCCVALQGLRCVRWNKHDCMKTGYDRANKQLGPAMFKKLDIIERKSPSSMALDESTCMTINVYDVLKIDAHPNVLFVAYYLFGYTNAAFGE
jgi:hypothetical protein